MKRTHLSVPATTPVPVEKIRSYLGMPETEASNPQTSENSNLDYAFFKFFMPAQAVTGTSRSRYNRVIKFYDGKIPFTVWLKSEEATIERLQLISSVIMEEGISAKLYLNKLGTEPPDIIRGRIMAHMNLMFFEVRLNDILRKFKSGELRDITTLFEEEVVMNSFLQGRDKSKWIDIPLLEYLKTTNSADELGQKIFAHFYPVKNTIWCRQKLWFFLVQKYYQQFYRFLRKSPHGLDFLTSYLQTMMEYFHMINLADPYWQNKGWDLLRESVSFYRRVLPERSGFVENHLPNTLSILRKKRAINFQLLHTLWIKHMIYTSSIQYRSYNKLMIYLKNYEFISGITIHWKKTFSEDLYWHLSKRTEMNSNRILEEVFLITDSVFTPKSPEGDLFRLRNV